MRISYDEYYMRVARASAQRSTCGRRKVGCVLVDKRGHIVGTGYNGTARKEPHCWDEPCPGLGAESGEALDECYAVHAEQNALLQCPDVDDIAEVFVTCSPCMHCMKMIKNTSAKRLVYEEVYDVKALKTFTGSLVLHTPPDSECGDDRPRLDRVGGRTQLTFVSNDERGEFIVNILPGTLEEMMKQVADTQLNLGPDWRLRVE